MLPCTLVLKDYCNAKFEGLDPIVRKKFLDELKVMVPYARHTPQFKLKRWDGKIAFGTVGGGTFINLLDRVLPIIEKAGYEITLDDRRPVLNFGFPVVTEEMVADRFWPTGHLMAGEPIMLRDYQVEAIQRYFENPQSLQCISTGAGKTLLTACLSLAVEQSTGGRSIIIVPSKSLVEQTEEDYRNLGLDVGVFYGDRKNFTSQHTICTWQSLTVFDKKSKDFNADIPIEEFLEDVVCVMVDEAHSIKGTLLKDLLCGPMAHIPIRWGLTGTIPKEEFEFLSLLAAIGPVVGEIRADTLQAKEVLADCEVQVVQLDDSHVEWADYDSEYKYLVSDAERITWLAEYCMGLSQQGNTLILVDRRETGFMLEKLIPGSVFVYGDMTTKNRKVEYDAVQTSNDKVIIATYGVAAVGINVPRLFNCVLLEPGKSFIRTIQSIGRVLRRANDKKNAVITDFTSNLKFSKRHAAKRREFYRDAGYPYTITKVKYRS